ncbi:MAG: hypothetical protein QOH06_4592 [Acidobacteriota bacterium]|jgi:hypothetical protein|nr:hypothetical protein [Acidobacteriota bacterium]
MERKGFMGILTGVDRLKAGILLALFLAAFAVPASAGDFRVVLDAEGTVRSDGNYDQVQQLDEPGLEDDGEENVARTGFNLRLSYQLPRWLLALGYSPSYEWVLDESETHGTTHRLDFGLSGNLTRRLSMQVRERLLSSPGLDLYSPYLVGEPVAVTRRGDQLTHALDIGLAQTLTRRTSLLLGAAHTLRTFEESDLSDTETLSARIGIGTELAQDRRLDFVATAGNYDFGERERPGLGGNLIDQAADVQTLSVSWQQPFLRDGRFHVEAGMFAVDSTRTLLIPDPVNPAENEPTRIDEDFERTGWRGGLDLSRQLELFAWNVGLRHDVSAGAGLGRATEMDNVSAGLSTNIGRRLVLGLDGSFSRYDDLENDLEADPAVVPEDRILESVTGGARLSWSFSTIARLTGGYSRIWQESRIAPFEDLSYSRYFVGLALQLYRSGEEPQNPARQEVPEDEQPDAQ